MVKFEDIDPAEIKEGLLLGDDQIDYIHFCLKDARNFLETAKRAFDKQGLKGDTYLFTEKLIDDLKYCVTILRKEEENDL